MVHPALVFTDRPEQAHRIQRYFIGVASSVLVWALMFLLYAQGHIEATALVRAGVAMLFLFVAFYALFRTHVNLRASDPSLTSAQILSSIAVTLYAMYFTSSEARTLLSLVFIMSFFFGVFRLGTRQFAMIAALTVAGYLVVIGLLARNRAHAVDLNLELMRCAATAAVLFWFSVVGGYLSRLRKRLADGRAKLEKAVRTIKEQVDTDELTGTHSRRYLLEVLERERSHSRRTGGTFCVCIADIDRFKQINDTFGHHAGDQVLRSLTRAAQRGLRVTDYFGRYGGDELMLVLTGSTLEGALLRAEQVRARIEHLTFPDLDPVVKVTVSIGVAQFCKGDDTADIIRRADNALYEAKQGGRNRVALAEGSRTREQVG